MDTTHNPHHARRWLVLAVLGVAQLMVILDATIVNIALPAVSPTCRSARRPSSESSPRTP